MEIGSGSISDSDRNKGEHLDQEAICKCDNCGQRPLCSIEEGNGSGYYNLNLGSEAAADTMKELFKAISKNSNIAGDPNPSAILTNWL